MDDRKATDTFKRASNVDNVSIEKVIHITSITGEGKEDDPYRPIEEYYTLDGVLIVRIDTWKETHNKDKALSSAE